MDVMIILIIGIIVAVVIGAALRALRPSGTRSPEDPTPDAPASHDGREGGGPDIPSDPGESRPAGPGAEAMAAPEAGDPAPGSGGPEGEPDAVPPSDAGRKDLSDDA